MIEKSPEAFKTISEAADELGVEQHVLRFWETKFTQIKPLKRRGGRRYYRPEDMEVLHRIKELLYKQGFTIKGAKKAFAEKSVAVEGGLHAVETLSAAGAPEAAQLDLLGNPIAATPVKAVTAEAKSAAATGLSKKQRDDLQSVLKELQSARKRLQSAA